MQDFERFQSYIPLIRIAHHIPGRIRFKLNQADARIQQLAGQAGHFGAVWQGVPGIRSAKLNLLARSCTVEYDPQLIPFQAWPDLLDGVRSDAAQRLLEGFKHKTSA
jgi:hypothetical protein